MLIHAQHLLVIHQVSTMVKGVGCVVVITMGPLSYVILISANNVFAIKTMFRPQLGSVSVRRESLINYLICVIPLGD